MPVFVPVAESDVGENNITLRWIAGLGPDPYELVVKNQNESVEETYYTNQSGSVISFNPLSFKGLLTILPRYMKQRCVLDWIGLNLFLTQNNNDCIMTVTCVIRKLIFHVL